MSRKHKILVILLCSSVISFIIFIITFNNNVNYLSLGNELSVGMTPFNTYNKSYSDYFVNYLENKNNLKSYNKTFSKGNYYITDLINEMSHISCNDAVNINQLVVHADVITISFGQPELNTILLNNYQNHQLKNLNKIYKFVDNYFKDYTKLLNKIRKINDCKIYIIGYYNPLVNANQKTITKLNDLFEYINNLYTLLEEKKNIYYINIYNEFNNKGYYLPCTEFPYPSIEGYNYINNQLIKKYINS